MDSEIPVKEYTGVWIPSGVMESTALTPLDKLIYAEMAGFIVCFASNDWFAQRVGRSEATVRRSISRLIKSGYVENLGFDGRRRQLRVRNYVQAGCAKMSGQPAQKCAHNNKDNNKDNISTNVDSGVPQNEAVEKSEYGNHEVNALLELWEHETGLTANVAKANRLAAYNLLRRKGFDGAKKIVEMVGRAMRSGDRYAPRIASFRDLQGQYEKLSKLEAWQARQNEDAGITVHFYERQGEQYTEISDDEREKVREQIKQAKIDFMRGQR